MYQVRIHGRGGQGVVTAAELLSVAAFLEARRCLSCSNCFACDNCFGVRPDNAAVKLDDRGPYRYEIDLDFCKGCGLCAEECPCGAIEMEAEAI